MDWVLACARTGLVAHEVLKWSVATLLSCSKRSACLCVVHNTTASSSYHCPLLSGSERELVCIYWMYLLKSIPFTKHFFASWVMGRSDMQRHNLPEFRLMLKVILKCYSVWSCEIAAVAYMESDQGAHSNIKLIHSYASRLMERSACLKGD